MAAGFRAARPLVGALVAPLPLLLDGRRRWTGAGGVVRNEGLDSKSFAELRCLKNEQHTHDTRKITFQLPNGEARWTTQVPITNVLVGVPFQEPGAEAPKVVARPYNPLTVDEPGSLTILVKKYQDAKIGSKLHSLEVGQTIGVKGGRQQWPFEPHKYTHYGMVAGGTGITPLIQAASHILEKDSVAKVTLVCANKTPQDILLLDELAALQKAYPKRLAIFHHVDSVAGTQVTPELLKRHMPAAGPGVLIMVCGPMGMLKAVAGPKAKDYTQGEVGGFLKDMGYSQVHVWKV